MKRSELTNRQKLLVPCPICGAAIGVRSDLKDDTYPKLNTLFWELQLSYLDEEKRTNQPTETIGALSDLRCRHRRALSDVFRSRSAQRATCRAEVSGSPSHR